MIAVDNSVLTAVNDSTRLQTFNPFTETPVRGVHYQLPPSFGKPTSAADYPLPRTFRVAWESGSDVGPLTDASRGATSSDR